MNLSRNQVIIVGIVLAVVLFFVLGFMGIIPGIVTNNGSTDPNFPTTPIKLTIWGIGDSSTSFDAAIAGFKATYKNVDITYTKFDSPDTYLKSLLNALAERKGPDIFMVNSSWIYEHWGKMYPAPATIITPQMMTQLYPDVVSKDFTLSGNIYALPLYLDSLALIYNKDIFNDKAIIDPPQTWDDVLADVLKTRQLDENKKIQLAGISLGTSKNIRDVSDILLALSIQSGAPINPQGGVGVQFDANVQNSLAFYLQFSDPINTYYTWNEGFGDNLSEFASGDLAMLLGYYKDYQEIKNKNAFVNMGVAQLPQLKDVSAYQKANVSDYWGLTVSGQEQYPYVAWTFIKYLTTDPTTSDQYLTAAGHLPALKSLIQKGLGGDNDPFLRGLLISKTWQKFDYADTQNIIENMISEILSGKVTQTQGLRSAEQEINALYTQ